MAYIFIGYPPGPAPYAAGVILAVIYFAAAGFGWRGSEAIWMMGFTVLLMTMFWDIRNPIGSFPGLVLAVLTLMSQNQKHEAAEEKIDGTAEPPERAEPEEQ